MIVATAGHIDHGKTALIKALTGVDADRLPEEKKRGVTVDLGFAYANFDGRQTIGFVDVPGHEKLVRTMLAGATGVDFVLLCVAADDGIMPQTREHLSVIDLLGLGRGAVVVTKADRVAADRVAAVTAELQLLLADTALAAAPILPVSAHRGDGIVELRHTLTEAAANTATARDGALAERGFRLAVDRAFTLAGTGLVVTGTIHAGRVMAGDRLKLRRTGSTEGIDVRVRGLHAANVRVEHGAAGQRCALNIAGSRLDKAEIARGDWLIAPALPPQTACCDVDLRLLPGAGRALRHWTPVHIHIGAADVPGRVSLLESSTLPPGGRALCRLVLDAPTAVLAGDRLVIRDQSARETLGGGRVVDPQPPARGARKPDRLAALRALAEPDDAAAFSALLALAPAGVNVKHFSGARNITGSRRADFSTGCDGIRVTIDGTERLFHTARWHQLRADLLARLRAHAECHPDRFGAEPRELLAQQVGDTRSAASAALDRLCAEGMVVRFGQLVRLPDHVTALSSREETRWVAIERIMVAAACDPPRLTMVAEALGQSSDELLPFLDKLGRMGRLYRVSRHYHVLPAVMSLLAEHAIACAETHEAAVVTIGRFREATGISRNATMPVLEFFDRVGFTVRHIDGRRIRTSSKAIFCPAPTASPT